MSGHQPYSSILQPEVAGSALVIPFLVAMASPSFSHCLRTHTPVPRDEAAAARRKSRVRHVRTRPASASARAGLPLLAAFTDALQDASSPPASPSSRSVCQARGINRRASLRDQPRRIKIAPQKKPSFLKRPWSLAAGTLSAYPDRQGLNFSPITRRPRGRVRTSAESTIGSRRSKLYLGNKRFFQTLPDAPRARRTISGWATWTFDR